MNQKVKGKIDRIYYHLVEAKEIQCDIVSNDGKKMTKQERKKIIEIWNLLDKNSESC